MNITSAVGFPPNVNNSVYSQSALASFLQQDWSKVPDVGVENPIPPPQYALPIVEVLEEEAENVEEAIKDVKFSLKHDPQRRYKPYGTFAEAFYDRSEIVGFAGPAGTGKSRGILEKLHLICEKYEGARILIVRATREALSEAALMTYENQVLPAGHYLLTGAARSHRQKYAYSTGSEIIVGGLDKLGKLMSTEYDIVFIQEALDIKREDMEMLKTRLRNGILPYQQLIMDYNPGDPMHWLHQAALAGEFVEYNTVHEDNPILWEEAPQEAQDAIKRLLEQNGALGKLGEMWPVNAPDGRRGRWTQQGVSYIAKLDGLTGARKLRLRYGIWATAEGAVYQDCWHRDINLIKPFEIPAAWRRIWIIDFGFTSPFVLHMLAVDPVGTMFTYREIYHTRRTVEAHAKQALAICGYEFRPESGYIKISNIVDTLPECVVCDVDAEGRETFEQKSGIRCVAAYKSSKVGIDVGIQATQQRLKANEQNQSRWYIFENAVIERDPLLKDGGLPQCTVEEIDGYVWDTTGNQRKGERPLDKNNHGMDAMRYGVCYVDNIVGDVKAGDVVMGAEEPYPGMVVAVPGFRENNQRYERRVPSDDAVIRVHRHDDGMTLHGSKIGGRRASNSSKLSQEYEAKTGRVKSGHFGR
jgi:phage terminase large subunit